MNLEFEIRKLINSKREGDYWDFKEEPHDNKASLLHDILCLANSLHRGNKYLIFGVTDPNNGAQIKGLTSGQKNRKAQIHFIDFLRTKPFAGDCHPEIGLHTLIIDKLEIDVLIVFDNPSKPYYLTEDYKDKSKDDKEKVVRANYIYTRVNDTNTPIDKSADIGLIEKMWKQRFGLDISPLEKMKLLLLKPNEWFKDIGNKSYVYHKEFPEFRIDFSKVSEFWEVFSYFYTNEKSYLGTATFKYHSTTLFELEYMYCDEMRIELAVPKTEYLKLEDYENWYYYFELDDLNGKFLYFMTDKLSRLSSRGVESPFIIFNNVQERKRFNKYVIDNQSALKNIKPDFFAEHAKKMMNQQKKGSVIDPIFISKIKQLYEKWDVHNML